MTERSRLRMVVLRVLVVSILATLLGRLAYLQVAQGPAYARAASANRIRSVITSAARGEVLDDRGVALISNRTALVVRVDRTQLRASPHHGVPVLARLSTVIGMPVPQLGLLITPCGERFRDGTRARRGCWSGSPYQPVPVATYATDRPAELQRVLAVEEHAEDFPGVSVGYEAVRQYPKGSLASHSLGYVGRLTADDLRRTPTYAALAPGSLVGRTGLEASYDAQLRGRDGVQRLVVDKDANVTDTLGSTPALAGADLVLSIDAGVQQATEAALAKGVLGARATGKYPAPGGSAIVLEAATGRLVALASYPTYDPAVFVGKISDSEFAALNNDPSHPLTSNATQGTFAPGSTFKLSSTAAVVNAGGSLYGSYACPPSLMLGNHVFNNFEGEQFGTIDLTKTLVKSCDTVYYQQAYDEWVRDGATRNRPAAREVFARTARSFGFGGPTGVDLPDERSGTITDRASKVQAWKQLRAVKCARARNGYPEVARTDAVRADYLKALAREFCDSGYVYQGGDAVLFAIGQGDALVTPLQMAMAYGALANGGTLFAPRLAKGLLSVDGRTSTLLPPVARSKVDATPATLAYIRNALAQVTGKEGTAAKAFAGFPQGQLAVAGKTGTADAFNKQPTSWFASFAPASAPKYVVVVSVPEGGQGGITAAPIARQIYDAMYGLEGHRAVLPAGGALPAGLPVIKADGSVGAPGTRLAVPPRRVVAPPGPLAPGTGLPVALTAPAGDRPLRTLAADLPAGYLPRRTRDRS